jgi:single-stranded-DNA-specific exonuclease
MKYEQWNSRPTDLKVRRGLEAAGVPFLNAAVLCARGLDTIEECRSFFADGEELLHDPMCMRDMDKAVARIQKALADRELIAVYGDYDVDGITSTCLLTHYLRNQGATVNPYIPDRLEEGYGLNHEAVRLLAERGTTLIVTVDCGITAVEEIAYAATLGVDVVITDHHECKEPLPAAVAVVNPHRPDCTYPFSDLAGVGVAFKLVLALGGASQQSALLGQYADLAAIGTIADVMRLVDENRAIVHMGLGSLQKTASPGLRALFREAGVDGKPITAITIGYVIAPRINASGRMGKATLAQELLLTQDVERADALARELCALNRERQTIEGQIYEESVARVELESTPPRAIVLADCKWHQGVVGIVASRLAERFRCPVFMICLSEGKGKGSCRSFGGVNLFAALEQCNHLLEGFGGHALAAGFTIREEYVDGFRDHITACITASTGDAPICSTLMVDVALENAEHLTQSEVKELAALEPHGSGNPRPLFSLTGATVAGLSDVGAGRHLKLSLRKGHQTLDAIFFSINTQQAEISIGDHIDVAFSLSINEFRGRQAVQLQLEDLRHSVSRTEQERALFDRMKQGITLTSAEAKSLTPSREEFAAVWRYIKCNAGCSRMEDEPVALSHSIAKTYRLKETYMRTMVCLEVLDERGLICVKNLDQSLSISVVDGVKKVDLEESCIMRRLRALACESRGD